MTKVTFTDDGIKVVMSDGKGAQFAAIAETAADLSESARDIAQAAAGVDYPDAAAALAGASNGDKFTYWDGDQIVYSTKTAGVLVELAGPWIGADKIGFTQSGTGAVARDAQSKMGEQVSVFDFMTEAEIADVQANTATLNVTAAIQAAVDKVATTGGELIFPPGTYKITSKISKTFGDGIAVLISGYGAKIDATAITTGNAIELGGSRVSSTALGADVSKNSDTYTVASATGVSVGRVLLITSTDLWNPTRAYYYKGEISLVEKITGTTITNHKPIYDGYTAATTTVHILNMPQITVEGIEISCNADVIALQILYARNPTVRKCSVHGSRYAGIYVGYCLGGTIDSNYVYDVWNGVVTSTSYGILVGTGQGVKVVNNIIAGGRHSISGGGLEPLRDVTYANNTCYNSTLENISGCIDTHGNTEFAVATGNVASSITFSGINSIIANNILNSAEYSVPGITIYQEIDSDYYIINGNRISCAGANTFGVFVSPSEANLNIEKLIAEGNVVEAVLNAMRIQPRNSSATGCSITNAIIRGNTLKSTGAAQAFAITVNGAASYSVTDLLTSGNLYEAASHDSFSCSGAAIVTTVSIGDTFKANRLNGSIATFGGADVRLVSPSFYGNTGGVGNSRSVLYQNTGRISVNGPSYSNITYKAEVISATEYQESGWHSATPTIVNTAGARLVNFYGALGRAISYATAAPTTNTWAVGDRVFNQTPSVGQPKSWVCTVAGTPGTWVSEGNL